METILNKKSSQKILPKLNRKPEYFFNKTHDNMSELSATKNQIQLNLSIRNSQMGCKYYIETECSDVKLGKTEIVVAEGTRIDFEMTFITDYHFEKQQDLLFKILKDKEVFKITTTVGNVMGSRGQVMAKNYQSSEELIIQASKPKETESNSICMNFQFENLQGINSRIFFYIKTSEDGMDFTTKYKSEIQKTALTMKYETVRIPSIVFGYLKSPLAIQVFQCDIDTGDHKAICGHITSVNSLINDEKVVTMNDLSGQPLLTLFNNTYVSKDYTFLDYIRGGLQIALTIGIDFTASNGQPDSSKSLHFISAKLNSYEKAIRACGDIVAYYDYDQLFPVYGYGAILLTNPDTVNHCFPLNFQEDPNIISIDAVLQCYRQSVDNLKFYGPTYFAPIIHKVISTVKADNNPNVYNILLILTDGIINDMNDTIDALVEASYLPISVIIVGIGYADFAKMDILDADENPLYDTNGRQAARDLVQFVPFHLYQNDGKLLAEQVLEEIPRQLVEYYRMKNIKPGEQIDSKI
jgi:hypothetical protein